MAEAVEVCGEIIKETDDAVLFTDGDIEVWIPKSVIEERQGPDEDVELELPEWFAIRNDLV
jgi:hypothetical protein